MAMSLSTSLEEAALSLAVASLVVGRSLWMALEMVDSERPIARAMKPYVAIMPCPLLMELS